MINFIKALLFLWVTVIMGTCLIILPTSAGSVSIVYTAAVGTYLGLDVANMIVKTANLPKGEFKSLSKHKYIISSISLIILIIISIYMKNKADVSTAITSFISSIIIIATCVIGGLEGNKMVTGTPEGENSK